MAVKSVSRKPAPVAIGVACFSVAACSAVAEDGRRIPSSRVQLLPFGQFRGLNGAPKDAPHWYVDDVIGERLAVALNNRQSDLVIDYDHQSLYAAKTGVQAVAAAWWSRTEWEKGVGLFAVDVDWKANARSYIESDEFRYISPVIAYQPKTGEVVALVNAALTNNPNIDGMADVAHMAANSLIPFSVTAQSTTEASMNEELLQQLIWMLGMPLGSTAEEVMAQLQKIITQLKDGPAQAAASFNLSEYIANTETRIAAASRIDLAQYVPMATFQATQTELLDLKIAANAEKVDVLVKASLADCRLMPGQEKWARDLGAQNFAALSQFVDATSPNPALSGGTQTGGAAPAGGGASNAKLSEAQLAVCSQMNISPEDFAQTLAE